MAGEAATAAVTASAADSVTGGDIGDAVCYDPAAHVAVGGERKGP